MSEAANRKSAVKRHWAEPGSRHDKVVRATKFGLPVLIGGLALLLAIAPFDKRGDVSFILDKNKVDQAQERMRVEKARYVGEDNKGQKFLIIADRAVQPTSNVPVVAIGGMKAQLSLDKGPLSIAALRGRYNLEQERVLVDGPVRVAGPDYQLATRDVTVDLDKRNLVSRGPVSGQMELGQFQAGQLKADLDERTVSLDKGVRLKISPTSNRSKSMPASCAMAGRCSAALVEPPVAATVMAAFSNALRVTMSRGRILDASNCITCSPAAAQSASRIS